MDRQAGATVDRKHAEVVDAVDVICVRMGQEHGVDVRDFCGQQLKAKLRRRIDEQRAGGGLEKQSVPRTVVPHVAGCAHRARTAHDRNPERGAGTEERQPQPSGSGNVSTRM
jgi:hypothetical protein